MKKILVSGRYKHKPKVYAIIDDEDFEKVSQYTWYLNTNSKNIVKRYAYCFPNGLNQGILMMHRLVTGLSESDKRIPDHKNHNTLDNRKQNLKIVTRSGNSMNMKFRTKLCSKNKSGYRGVCQVKGRWYASLQRRFLGSYDTAEEAARVYDVNAKKAYGQNAILNFP